MNVVEPHSGTRPPSVIPLTRNQIRGFWASWGGWALDGMDSFIYALVLVPSLRDLLPRSGIAATKGNIGFYGGLLFALFLTGWGLAFLWGPIGDKFGRVRTLMLTIVWYSLFTFLSAFVTSVWQLAILRLLAGIGIGGEWAMGGTFVAEEWPESRRRAGAGYMHTGYYVGTFWAAILNYGIGTYFGTYAWRVMFAVGGLPALLLAWVRHGVTEPARWKKKAGVLSSWHVWQPFAALFAKALRRRTILNSLYMLVSICGLWAGTVYVPAAVTALAETAGGMGHQAAQLASRAAMLVSFATILGCLAMPWLEQQFGRRGAKPGFLWGRSSSLTAGWKSLCACLPWRSQLPSCPSLLPKSPKEKPCPGTAFGWRIMTQIESKIFHIAKLREFARAYFFIGH